MKIKFLFKWYDFWIGIFYDRKNRWIYILPLPMVGIIIKLSTCQFENDDKKQIDKIVDKNIKLFNKLRDNSRHENKTRSQI